jgi:hypothetical protein
MASWAHNLGWVVGVGTHVKDEKFTNLWNPNHTFNLDWSARTGQVLSNNLFLHWTYHMSEITFDFEAETVRFFNHNDNIREATLPFAKIRQGSDEVARVQSHRQIRIENIELPQECNPFLGLTFVERASGNTMFDLVVPAQLRIEPARLIQLITRPEYKRNG